MRVEENGTMSRTAPAIRSLRSSIAVVACLALLASAGCVRARAISSRAVDYNVAAEQARSEMLLLNILRARDRKPMVFTGLTRISGSLRQSGGIGAGAAIGSDAQNLTALSANIDTSDAPTFDVAVLDSQEFTRGIMTPLRFDVVEYFWDQGFNRELLLYLCVERIELACPGDGGVVETDLRILDNEPAGAAFDAFQSFVYAAADGGRWEQDAHQIEPVGPPVDTASVAHIDTLIHLAESELALRPLPGGSWQLEKTTSKRRLVVPKAPVCGRTDANLRLYESKDAFETAGRGGGDEVRARVVLRSPQSVLYFLGELIRPGGENALIRARQSAQSEASRRLFVVREAQRCARADVAVEYAGTRYEIPSGEGDCDAGRSMQVLAFAGQLLALQQSAKDLPAAGTLRVVGQ